MTIDLKSMTDLQQNRRPQAPQVQFMRLGAPLVITNSNLDGVHLVPEPGGRVRGRFRMDKQSKMDWTQLTAMLTPIDSSELLPGNFPGGRFSIARVQSDGSFDLPTVGAGEYRLAITASSNNLQDYYTKAVKLDEKMLPTRAFLLAAERTLWMSL